MPQGVEIGVDEEEEEAGKVFGRVKNARTRELWLNGRELKFL
jgi:hypothetical protein